MDEDILRQIEQTIDYEFFNSSLLHKAFTHSSTTDDRPRFRVAPYHIAQRTDALAFNTPEELEAIRTHYRRKQETMAAAADRPCPESPPPRGQGR